MSEHRAVLEALSRALSREAHILPTADLQRLSQFVFQQLHNRVQWSLTDGAAADRATQEGNEAVHFRPPPRFHVRRLTKESVAPIRTFVGHAHTVEACAFSPDERNIDEAMRSSR
jgi:hypothetical protein